MAMDTLITVSQDDRERAINRSRRKWQTDLQSNMYTEREIGREEGRVDERITIARNAIKKNLPVEVVADLTGLTVAEVESLQHSN